jgi:LytS/YehU family sensor histidine kinase
MNPITKNILFVMTGVYLVVFIVSAFKLMKLNTIASKRTKSLETKILETQLKLKEQELKYLKMQIHPHFLFNTLNTMYGFALKKADETPEMILKLSNLLDYLLYQVDKPFVGLEDEINHIEDYISLEQMRFNDTLKVNFSKQIHSESIEIAPMLFIPFVENSFKHGVIKNGVLHIDIAIKTSTNEILFEIKNSSSKDSTYNEGIGLENIKKRLELLYPNQYNLTIHENESDFEVLLKLNPKSIVVNG